MENLILLETNESILTKALSLEDKLLNEFEKADKKIMKKVKNKQT